MGAESTQPEGRVLFLFTRFPVPTETFLQREIRALKKHGLPLRVVSLFGGGGEFESTPIERFCLWNLLRLFFWIPYWVVRRPRAMVRMATAINWHEPANFLNLWENGLGLGYAIVSARRWKHADVRQIHGVWASAPATGAWALHLLTDIPFSFSGHAYDLFEHGGDWLLSEKMRDATFMRSSSEVGVRRFVQLGADRSRVTCIRRGLNSFPEMEEKSEITPPLCILSVGRLVEKMGYFEQLAVYRELCDQGISFTVDIYGGGPLMNRLCRERARLGLDAHVHFHGAVPFSRIAEAYASADIFLFTGRVAQSGDRAGLPNAVAEAMSWGVPVVAHRVGAVGEAITHGENGILVEWPGKGGSNTAHRIAHSLIELGRSPETYHRMRQKARTWSEAHYSAQANMRRLIKLLENVGEARP